MSIPFHCPHCGVFTEVEDRFAGQTGDCATCGKSIEVPAATRRATIGPKNVRVDHSGGAPTAILAMFAFGCGTFILLFMVMGFGSFFFFRFAPPPVPAPVATAPTRVARTTSSIQCSSNLQQISVAIKQYEKKKGSLPPAYLMDDDGNPAHSWRVLLLPYLGHKTLYDQYDFTQPWDSPANDAVRQQIPTVYQCPDSNSNGTKTNYVVIVGKDTAFSGAKGRQRSEIQDAPSETFLVVEVPTNSIDWLSPDDPSLDDLSLAVDSGDPLDPGSDHVGGGAHVVYADGTIDHLPDYMPAHQLKFRLTIDKGDMVLPLE
jgi:hypothetical protein